MVRISVFVLACVFIWKAFAAAPTKTRNIIVKSMHTAAEEDVRFWYVTAHDEDRNAPAGFLCDGKIKLKAGVRYQVKIVGDAFPYTIVSYTRK